MKTIRILVIDPLVQSRERLQEALGHRFAVSAVESRLQALDILRKTSDIRLILVSSFQLEWKGKQLARHIKKRVGASCPTIWHYGEVDGCARVSEVVASDYKQKYGIDKFLTATLAPPEIARAVGAHFYSELLVSERGAGGEKDGAASGDAEQAWSARITTQIESVRRAIADLVTPIDELPQNPRWGELLRARVGPKTMWHVLTKDIIEPVDELPSRATMRDVLLVRVNARNMAALVYRGARQAA